LGRQADIVEPPEEHGMRHLRPVAVLSVAVLFAAGGAAFGQATDDCASAPALIPDYTLSGKILEVRAPAGSTRQTSYVFQLSLTEVKTGLSVWEEEKQITKQGKRNAVGF
jgi:hypothetical protein